jgi:hypothetical protein
MLNIQAHIHLILKHLLPNLLTAINNQNKNKHLNRLDSFFLDRFTRPRFFARCLHTLHSHRTLTAVPQLLQDAIQSRNDLVDVLFGEHQGWLDLDHVAIWTVRADQDVLLSHSATKQKLFHLSRQAPELTFSRRKSPSPCPESSPLCPSPARYPRRVQLRARRRCTSASSTAFDSCRRSTPPRPTRAPSSSPSRWCRRLRWRWRRRLDYHRTGTSEEISSVPSV